MAHILINTRAEFDKELLYFGQEIIYLDQIITNFSRQTRDAELSRMNNEYIQKIGHIKDRIRADQIRFVKIDQIHKTNNTDYLNGCLTREYYNTKLKDILTLITDLTIKFEKIVELHKMRRLKIAYPDITEDQVKNVQIDQIGDLFKLQMLGDNKGITDALSCIESRHVDILNLERSVIDLYELFRDMALLVDLQSEQIDSIAINIKRAEHHAEVGLVNIQDAEEYQKKSRKRNICLLMCLLLILVIIIIGVVSIKELKII